MASSKKGAAVIDAKEVGAPDSEGAATAGNAGFVKGVARYVEGAAVADAKESGAPSTK